MSIIKGMIYTTLLGNLKGENFKSSCEKCSSILCLQIPLGLFFNVFHIHKF